MKIEPFVSKEWALSQAGIAAETWMEMSILIDPEKRRAFIEECAQPGKKLSELDIKILKKIHDEGPLWKDELKIM